MLWNCCSSFLSFLTLFTRRADEFRKKLVVASVDGRKQTEVGRVDAGTEEARKNKGKTTRVPFQTVILSQRTFGARRDS